MWEERPPAVASDGLVGAIEKMGTGTTDNLVDEQWASVCSRLRMEIGEAAYQSWVKPMTVRGVRDGQVRISVPTRFMRDWVVAHYADRLFTLWNGEDAAIRAVDVFVQPERYQETSAPPDEKDSAAAARPATAYNGGRYNDDLSAPLDRRFTF